MVKLSPRQRAALVVVQAQHTTNPGSYVLMKAVGNRVGRTLESLVERDLLEKIRRTDTQEIVAYSYRITDAGRAALVTK